MTVVEQFVPSGRLNFEQIESGPRYFELIGQPVIQTVPELPLYDYDGQRLKRMDTYNPSEEVDGEFALRREERYGMYRAKSYMCRVAADGQIKLRRDASGAPMVVEGEDPALVAWDEGTKLWRVTVPTWPADMTPDTFDMHKAERLDTFIYTISAAGEVACIGSVEGKGNLPFRLRNRRKAAYYRLQNRSNGSVRDVTLKYVEGDSIEELIEAQAADAGELVGDGAFGLDTGGGVTGAYDMGNGYNLLLKHHARDLGKSKQANIPPPCRYAASMSLHDRLSGQLHWLGAVASRSSWGPWNPANTKYEGRDDVAYPSGMHGVQLDAQGHIVFSARAGLGDTEFGLFTARSIVPYRQILTDIHNSR